MSKNGHGNRAKIPPNRPHPARKPRLSGSVQVEEDPMDWLLSVSFDNIVMSAITCLVLREVMILTLPDAIAGPGGWLIDSDPEDD